jgi:hypothetical protein
MESEKNFFTKPEKPPELYHASRESSIEVFKPRIGKRRDENEGAQIFATPSKAMATVFLVETDDSWTQSGAKDGVPYIIISDRERFESLDQGGTIYSLPSDSFETDTEEGLRDLEYTSEDTVKPIGKETFDSAITAMIDYGVKVYFVDKETFEKIQSAPDHGEKIVDSLEPALN